MSDVPTSSNSVSFGGVDQELNQLVQQSQPGGISQPHQPGMFRRVLGAVTGMAGNAFAPGLGGALGNLIGGGSSTGSDPSQYLQLAQQVNSQEEAYEAVSNVLKAKHSSAMAAIQNIGS